MFDKFYKEYDEWFEKHKKIYEEEIKTIKVLLPKGEGFEIGIGTGRFAVPLGIKKGCEISKNMGKIAQSRGVEVIYKSAEELNFKEEFDFILIVTTICFVKEPLKTIQNSYNALKKGGFLLVAFIDKDSPLGKFYLKNKDKSKFYKNATFFNKIEIMELLKKAGFKDFECVENLYGDNLDNLTFGINPCNGGAFKVIKGQK